VALDYFSEIIGRLLSKFTFNKNEGHLSFESLSSTSLPASPWSDAYEAETLLGTCSILVKNVPFFSFSNWTLYFYTFLLYLSHPASTVRQECSSIFRQLMAKNPDPYVVKMLLQCLSTNWKTDCVSQLSDTILKNIGLENLEIPHQSFIRLATSPQLEMNNNNNTKDGAITTSSDIWEWKEGRLLAYELIFKFLLSNHTHYTFPFSPTSGPPQVSASLGSLSPPHATVSKTASDIDFSRLSLSKINTLRRSSSAHEIRLGDLINSSAIQNQQLEIINQTDNNNNNNRPATSPRLQAHKKGGLNIILPPGSSPSLYESPRASPRSSRSDSITVLSGSLIDQLGVLEINPRLFVKKSGDIKKSLEEGVTVSEYSLEFRISN
jgi:hypothetical protein